VEGEEGEEEEQEEVEGRGSRKSVSKQAQPFSMAQVREHPSLANLFPLKREEEEGRRRRGRGRGKKKRKRRRGREYCSKQGIPSKQAQPCSMAQVGEHPSLANLFPSSQGEEGRRRERERERGGRGEEEEEEEEGEEKSIL
jgi:hypothetical protein